MTKTELNTFLVEKIQPGPITYGDFKKYSILSTLFFYKITNLPCDLEILAMATELAEPELKKAINNLISEGVITEEDHILMEGKLYRLKLEADNEKPSVS